VEVTVRSLVVPGLRRVDVELQEFEFDLMSSPNGEFLPEGDVHHTWSLPELSLLDIRNGKVYLPDLISINGAVSVNAISC
jgi:hypothetical protein